MTDVHHSLRLSPRSSSTSAREAGLATSVLTTLRYWLTVPVCVFTELLGSSSPGPLPSEQLRRIVNAGAPDRATDSAPLKALFVLSQARIEWLASRKIRVKVAPDHKRRHDLSSD